MPGLTFAYAERKHADKGCDFSAAQKLLLHSRDYAAKTVVEDQGLQMGWVAYPEYPIRVFRGRNCLIYLEGRVYNRPAASVEEDLIEISASALGAAKDDSGIERFTRNSEGSYFVMMVRPETRELLAFSDPLCRLPLYYSVDDSHLFLSREAKFVHALRPERSFDRIGCAEMLAFGMPLGERTVLDGIRSFPDAGLLRAEVNDGRLRWNLRKLGSWNLDEEDGSKSIKRQAAEFAELFVTACRDRSVQPGNRGNLVSLSGGHDSRAVAAALVRTGTGVVAVTYRDPNGKRENEVRCAQQLAQALGIEWHCIEPSLPTESMYEELAWLKDGMNWCSMSFMLSYLEQIIGRWGRDWTYWSGGGGDDCLKAVAPQNKFWQLDDIVTYYLDKETCIRPDFAEAMLKLPANTLKEELRSVLEGYPEKSLARRIKHFKIFEEGRRCYYEGEDRSRFFLWHDSPYYAIPVYRHCLRIPDRMKKYKIFCRQALQALSPLATTTPVIASGHPPNSWNYAMYHRAREFALEMPSPLLKLVRFVTRSVPKPLYFAPEPFRAYLKNQLVAGSPLDNLLDEQYVSRCLTNIDAHAFFCFWTIAMLEKAYRLRIC
jgi:asparagine synthase (glutamine-hydrolysing)